MSKSHEYLSIQPGHVVSIGWDNPMMTYFAQVTRETESDDDEEDSTVLWLGSVQGDIKTPEVMVEPLKPWFDLTAELIELLKKDRLADIDRAPTVLQRQGAALFAPSPRKR